MTIGLFYCILGLKYSQLPPDNRYMPTNQSIFVNFRQIIVNFHGIPYLESQTVKFQVGQFPEKLRAESKPGPPQKDRGRYSDMSNYQFTRY